MAAAPTICAGCSRSPRTRNAAALATTGSKVAVRLAALAEMARSPVRKSQKGRIVATTAM
jgi:predicted Fe-S protein YdhL (DUF1289 family)